MKRRMSWPRLTPATAASKAAELAFEKLPV
jgi:hypothetical protein